MRSEVSIPPKNKIHIVIYPCFAKKTVALNYVPERVQSKDPSLALGEFVVPWNVGQAVVLERF